MVLGFSDFVKCSENFFYKSLGRVTFSAGTGYMAVRVFTKLNPMDGLYFGAIIGLVNSLSEPIFDALLKDEKRPFITLLGRISQMTFDSGLSCVIMKGVRGLPLKASLELVSTHFIASSIIGISFMALTILAYGAYKGIKFSTSRSSTA
jgi:hypothetical protein